MPISSDKFKRTTSLLNTKPETVIDIGDKWKRLHHVSGASSSLDTNQRIYEPASNVDRNPEEGTMIQDYNSSNSIERLNVYFNFDDATVSERYDKEIRALAAKYDEGYRFVVIGHTDHRGSETYNLILSKKRAEVVSRKLGANSIDNELINVYYYGEWKPLKSNDNKEGRNFNRRVEILVERL